MGSRIENEQNPEAVGKGTISSVNKAIGDMLQH